MNDMTMPDVTITKNYYLLRWFHPTNDEPVVYAYETGLYRGKRDWSHTTERALAYRFYDRGDARRTTRSTAFSRWSARGFFWEIVKVTETIVTSFAEELVVSDAPAMVQIARGANG